MYILDSGLPTHTDITQVNDIFTTDADLNGHATHISGIVSKIAPECEIVPIKITSISPNIELIREALTLILKNKSRKRVDIVNMSLSFSLHDKKIYKLIKKLNRYNIPVISASGNTTGQGSWYPAKYKETISVSSHDEQNEISQFNSDDDTVDIYVPGEDIESTWTLNRYITKSGTSQASGYLSGILAVLLSVQQVKRRTADIKSYLKRYVIQISSDNVVLDVKNILLNPIIPIEIQKIRWYHRVISFLKKRFNNEYITDK